MTSRLLLIDDDSRLTDMVGDYLRRNGFEMDTAGTLATGRERLKTQAYDALLLDLMLPDGNGLDMTRELRGQARTRRAWPACAVPGNASVPQSGNAWTAPMGRRPT